MLNTKSEVVVLKKAAEVHSTVVNNRVTESGSNVTSPFCASA